MSRYTNVDCAVPECNQYHKPNLPLLRKIVDQIVEKPSSWNQGMWGTVVFNQRVSGDDVRFKTLQEIEQTWDCQTAFCVAGHAAVLSGWEPVTFNPVSPYNVAEHPLGEHVSSETHGRQVHGFTVYSGVHGVSTVIRHSDGTRLSIAEAAQHELGLTQHEASLLFSGANTLDDVLKVCHRIAKRGHERWS